MPEAGEWHGRGGLTEPIVDHETEGLDMARPRRVNRAGLKRLGRRCLVVAPRLAALTKLGSLR